VKAYAVAADGSVSTTAAWDAATLMDATKRQNGLYSTATDGTSILFNSLDDAAFSAATPPVATIKSYTLNPSVSAGAYLAGRRNGSFLGSISRGNSLGLVTRAIDQQRYLDDTAYRTFYDGTVKTRSEKVLAASDDGFLYAFNQTDGELSWGWMPRSLAKELKDFSAFQGKGFMRGKLDVIDIKDSSGNYATYVSGAYKNGLGHYVLKLSSTGLLGAVFRMKTAAVVLAQHPTKVKWIISATGLEIPLPPMSSPIAPAFLPW
jgi:type IV pilus assembly protein PilY1